MPSVKTIISAAATAMVIRSVARDLIPHEFQSYFFLKLRGLLGSFSNQVTMIVEDYDGLYPNQLFQSAELYLTTVIRPDTRRFRVTKPENQKQIMVWMEKNGEVSDEFCGVRFTWRLRCHKVKGKHVANPDDYFHGSTLKTELTLTH
ncbi:hypothetical protein RHGRI_013538 [Rhododendron griersonianum]|uniref:AAA-type ATPase N-terminal domain-containing protein n=1 Tax=Rhododendron griersonianum TaxID=479676 RepID=A0AAV6K635_9ERIC|nr:hypothetical protein RHGRI_013538 [Rhododendron griersonianum]